MNIVIVWYEDDNFGDKLIRICFEQLLRVVLKNLKIDLNQCNMNYMPLKKINRELIRQSDIIFFAGGGLFGLSYLNFFDYLDEITKLAEEWNIPVVFSSIGINNMDATSEAEGRLRTILERNSVVAVSVRENLELFQKYSENCKFKVELVCDPATWTRYVYAKQLETIKKEPIIGINVVRGGLFKDNKKDWGLNREIIYLNELKNLLDKSSMKYCFFTNGSFLDNNALKYYIRENNIPKEQYILPDCTQDLVKAIAGFDFVVAIRMHASIISYAMETPSVNLVWNDKIPLFYKNINMPNQAIELKDWKANNIFNIINSKNTNFKINQDFLMTVYTYLYHTILKIMKADRQDIKMYCFKEVCTELKEISGLINEDVSDFRLKIEKGQNHYLARFVELLKYEQESKENKENKEMMNSLNKDINRLKQEKMEDEKKINQLKKTADLKTKELDRLNSKKVIKFLKKMNQVKRKIQCIFNRNYQ